MRLSTRTRIVLALSALVAASAGAGYVLPAHPVIAGLLLLFSGWQGYRVVHLTGRMNRKIAYLFESIRNNDFSFGGSSGPQDRSERFLHETMAQVCELMSKIRHDAKLQDQYYQIMLQHMQTGIVAVDTNGFVFQSNQAALTMLGLELLTHLNQLQQTGPDLYHAFTNIRAGENRQTAYVTERGIVRLSLHASPVFLYNRHLRLITLHDIENEMDEKEIESWIRLIRVLTHEIMNSVAPITSLSDTLLAMHCEHEAAKSHGQPAPHHRANEEEKQSTAEISRNTIQGLELIRDTSQRLREFVESYRKLTRIPKPEPTRFGALPFFKQSAALCQDAPNYARVSLTLHATPDTLEITADKRLLSQVMVNLLRNAYQALESRESGEISVSAHLETDGAVRITVADNGPGIDNTLLNDIFVPFFTTRPDGSGIGLSLSRQIIRMHGGTLKVHSLPEKETRFFVLLPTSTTK